MPGKKLLVADDSLTIQKVIRLALSNEGYDIQAVPDGTEAIQQIFLSRPDIVLIDVSLPGKSGFEVKREVNQHEDLEEVRFVLMSSAFEKVDEGQAEEVGFHARLTKPFDPAHLRKVLTDTLAQVAAKRMEKTSMLPRSKAAELPPKAPSSMPPTPGSSNKPQSGPPSPPPFGSLPSAPPSFPEATKSQAAILPEMTASSIDLPGGGISLPPELPDLEPSLTLPPEQPPSPPEPVDFTQLPSFDAPPALPADLEMGPPPTPDFPTLPDPMPQTSELPSLDWTESRRGIEPPPMPPGFASNPPKIEDDSDIKTLTASTIEISGLDDYQWSVEEPSVKAGFSAAPPSFSPPHLSPHSSPHLPGQPQLSVTQEELEALVKQQVQTVLKEMSQQMLPELAEKIIKNEIHRMLSEGM